MKTNFEGRQKFKRLKIETSNNKTDLTSQEKPGQKALKGFPNGLITGGIRNPLLNPLMGPKMLG
jgi:hypothetical protein